MKFKGSNKKQSPPPSKPSTRFDQTSFIPTDLDLKRGKIYILICFITWELKLHEGLWYWSILKQKRETSPEHLNSDESLVSINTLGNWSSSYLSFPLFYIQNLLLLLHIFLLVWLASVWLWLLPRQWSRVDDGLAQPCWVSVWNLNKLRGKLWAFCEVLGEFCRVTTHFFSDPHPMIGQLLI